MGLEAVGALELRQSLDDLFRESAANGRKKES